LIKLQCLYFDTTILAIDRNHEINGHLCSNYYSIGIPKYLEVANCANSEEKYSRSNFILALQELKNSSKNTHPNTMAP